MGLCRYSPRRQSLRHAARELPDGAGAGAAGDSRCRACRPNWFPAAPGSMTTLRAAVALPPSSAGRSRPPFRSSPWCCSGCRSPPIGWRRWCRPRSNGGSAMSPTPRSRRCSAPRSATMRPEQKAFVKLVTAIRESAGLDTSVQSGVLSTLGSQCLRAAGRQGLSVQRIAGEGRERRRDRRRAGPRTRPSQASRQHARADPQRRHVVSDRAAVRRHHRLQRIDFRVRARW